jgi:lipid II:glycine glycyltransferase (peptidoglycan interpeptide bridge formation enzyme)
LFGKKHNATSLDLWGILPPDVTDPKNPWAGFSDFKKGFGGEMVQMIGSYDFVAFPVLYWFYTVAFKLRKFLS